MPPFSPGIMEVTTVIGCKVNCHFCPQKALVTNYFQDRKPAHGKMSMETFRTCIDKLPSTVRIHLSGMAEPWLNENATEMLLYAAARGHSVSVYSTLSGMTQDDFAQFEDFRFDRFNIHIPDALGNTKVTVTPVYLALLKTIVETLGPRMGLAFQFSSHGPVHPEVRALLENELPRMTVIQQLFDRAGNLSHEQLKHRFIAGPIQCSSNGRQLNHQVLLPDGSVLLCCMDYNMEHVIGNLVEMSYQELFTTPESLRILSAMDDDRQPLLCRKCHVAQSCGPKVESRLPTGLIPLAVLN